MKKINSITNPIFRKIENYLTVNKLNEDKDPFHILKDKLTAQKKFSAAEFALEAVYVILASGFKQKTAKQKYSLIAKFLLNTQGEEGQTQSLAAAEKLRSIFNNRLKTNAIAQIWNNQEEYRNNFYAQPTEQAKLNYLQTLPFIGPITKNHLARNLGINIVKYDVWIQRIAYVLYGAKTNTAHTNQALKKKINTSPLSPHIRTLCDKMFDETAQKTGELIGYIDAVIWRAATEKILIPNLEEKALYLNL